MMTAEASGAWELRKRRLVIETAKKTGFRTLIETGTAHGAMVEACIPYFDYIYSIELSLPFYKECLERFKNNGNVILFNGDSAQILPKFIKFWTNDPAIYWLDAHCSGGDTAGDPDNPPLEAELKAIFDNKTSGIVLIDDQHLTDDELVTWSWKYPGFVNYDHISRINIARAKR